jgi:hypothetical protein
MRLAARGPRGFRLAMLALLATVPVAGQASGATKDSTVEVMSVAVEGTVLKFALADGRVLASSDLIGAKIQFDQGERVQQVRLDSVERDPNNKRRDGAPADAIWLHSFAVEGPDGSWGPLCEEGPDGRRQAIPLAGRFSSATGRFGAGGPGGFELACTAGAMGKCIRLGYHPWRTGDLPKPVTYHPDASHVDLFNACIRMIRADYGGDGTATTRNGMLIDVYDDQGIQSTENDHRMAFEAGWTPDGAVCVNHPRVKENISLGEIEGRWRRLAGETGASCTEQAARSLGALLFNQSLEKP